MKQTSNINISMSEFNVTLEKVVKEGACKLLELAIENEVQEYIEKHKNEVNKENKRLVIRNGYLPERDLITGIGPVNIKQPRVRDKREDKKFTSDILPPYMRRTKNINELIPTLYLKGISTGDFSEALKAILGENVRGLSPTNIVRLKKSWEKEYKMWQSRDLSDKHYVYWWADGIRFDVRLDNDSVCILVIIGATAEGKKEVLAIHDGYRESSLSWKEMLQDLKNKGLKHHPKLAIGDGALGFWKALIEEFPTTQHQRCWVHKTKNVLDKLPKRVQPNAKRMLKEIYMAPSKKDAYSALKNFIKLYEDKYEKACECLKKDKEKLLAFYDFPAQHWVHVRTTNPIESTFATIRHRTRQTKGCGSRTTTMAMVYKLALEAERSWRRLKGHKLIKKIIEGIKFQDGVELETPKDVVNF